MESIRAKLRGGERTRYFPLYVTIGNVMREFVSGSKLGKLLGRVMPLAGTRARSRNNGNRLNKYLPFPPGSEHTLRSRLPFISSRKVTISRRYNALTPLNRRLSNYSIYMRVVIASEVGILISASRFYFWQNAFTMLLNKNN